MKANNSTSGSGLSLDQSNIFGILLVLVWTRYTVVNYALIVISSLPIIGMAHKMYFPSAIILLIIMAWPWLIKRIKAEAIILYMIAVIVALSSMILFPKNAEFIEEKMGDFIIVVLPMVFVGMGYDHEKHKKWLFWASLIGTVTMVAYQIFKITQGEEIQDDDMDAAYKLLPSVMYLIYYAFEKKALKYNVLAILAGVTMFMFGTRGPILCILVFLLLMIGVMIRNNKSALGKLLTVVVALGVLMLLIYSDLLIELTEFLSEKFSEWGLSTRIFDYFAEGKITEDSGRGVLTTRVVEAIFEKPLLGHGLLGDRVVLENGVIGFYAHNLFLELWCQFGIIGGTAIAAYFVLRPIMAIIVERKNRSMLMFLLMLVCLNFVKLMLSSTYTAEQMFFFMIGVCIAASHKYKPIVTNENR